MVGNCGMLGEQKEVEGSQAGVDAGSLSRDARRLRVLKVSVMRISVKSCGFRWYGESIDSGLQSDMDKVFD